MVMRILDLYLGVDSPLHNTTFSPGQRARPLMGTRFESPDWTVALETASVLIRSCDTHAMLESGASPPPSSIG